jgi:fibronectin type 3 domain-containing protein
MKKLGGVMALAVFGLVFFGCDGTKLHLLVPENVTAEQIDGTTTVKLTWDPVALAGYYEVQRAGSDGPFNLIGYSDGKQVNGENGKSFYRDDTVAAGNTYRYRIRAMSAADDVVASGFSAVIEISVSELSVE